VYAQNEVYNADIYLRNLLLRYFADHAARVVQFHTQLLAEIV